MKRIKLTPSTLSLTISTRWLYRLGNKLEKHHHTLLTIAALILSWVSWFVYFSQGRQLVYNDAMSHLDIARRVFDNLTPGAAQLGSVWLPLLHVLMLPTIWIDSFWQTGLSAGIVSMTSYVLTVILIYKTARLLQIPRRFSFLATILIALNPNLLYLQTTALTEPVFIALYAGTMYFFIAWVQKKTDHLYHLITMALLVALSTLTRYDGWALYGFTMLGVIGITWYRYRSFKRTEGTTVLFLTLATFGIMIWFGWNLIIFGNPLYFAVGEYSAKAQQDVLAAAQDLPTKHNLVLSIKTYLYAMYNNIGILNTLLAIAGWIAYSAKKSVNRFIIAFVFSAPLVFNILALYLGHSVIHLPELFGASWFNVRYGLIMLPWTAIAIGYLASRPNPILRTGVTLVAIIQVAMFLNSRYIVTLDDGLWGSSQKNVVAVGDWIQQNIGPRQNSLILVSVASHDAILFQSGLNMNRYIHEGTAQYWDQAITDPSAHADFVIMRTHDQLDRVAVEMDKIPGFFDTYTLLYDDVYADVYGKNSLIQASSQP